MAGVVGIVATMPCCGMGITAPVTSWARAPCVGSPALRRGFGRDDIGARAQEGSGEAELAPEAKGSGEPWLAPKAKGSGEPVLAPEAEGSGEPVLAPEAKGSGEPWLAPKPW